MPCFPVFWEIRKRGETTTSLLRRFRHLLQFILLHFLLLHLLEIRHLSSSASLLDSTHGMEIVPFHTLNITSGLVYGQFRILEVDVRFAGFPFLAGLAACNGTSRTCGGQCMLVVPRTSMCDRARCHHHEAWTIALHIIPWDIQ